MPADPRRGLGVMDASLLVVGSILGAGIFFVSESVAANVRSPAAFFGVWLVGGLVALAGALCNGELGAVFPRGGGEYVYLREAYGPPSTQLTCARVLSLSEMSRETDVAHAAALRFLCTGCNPPRHATRSRRDP
jgi:amino acid transporter